MSGLEGAPRPPALTADERNALILRRTLSAISWIYAFWSGLFAAMALAANLRTQGPFDLRIILLHSAVLALAGTLTWKPRRGAMAAVLLAAAGSLYFVAADVQHGRLDTALLDGAYVPLAILLLFKSRRSP